LEKAGLLNKQGLPTSDRNAEARSWKQQTSGLKSEIEIRDQEIARLEGELSQRDAQIQILKELLTSIKKN